MPHAKDTPPLYKAHHVLRLSIWGVSTASAMALTMLLWAITGAAAHVGSTPGLWPKARLAASLIYGLLKELLAMALLLPSISHSLFLYFFLPSYPNAMEPDTISFQRRRLGLSLSYNISVARNLPYGRRRRNLLDLYIPHVVASEEKQRKLPTLLFVHGGVWASGSKELFAHMGACLAHSGVLTVVLQYTLFPEVLAREQARDVSCALTWVLDNIGDYGGDPQRVTLMGHSAGAHLCAVAIWERFKAAKHVQERQAVAEGDGLDSAMLAEFDEQDIRQPHNFIGMAGVYDVVEHLKHEEDRGVASMSAMTRAMGGKHRLEATSPVHCFQSVGPANHFGANGAGLYPAMDVTAGKDKVKHELAKNEGLDLCYGKRQRSDAGPDNLPNCTFLCSWNDIVVPPKTSISLRAVLQEQLGHDSQLIVFNDLRHNDFVNLDGGSKELASLRRHVLHISKS